jgi:FkbM family methyltransferase
MIETTCGGAVNWRVKALVREGTSDRFIVDEVVKGNTYRHLNITDSDTVLDVGMNIGTFSILSLLKGATVYAFEPDPENFKLALRNVELNGFKTKFYPHESAVIGTNDKHRQFSINSKKNKGAHSLVHKRGRTLITVKSENINTILSRVKPTVIKIDIEGGEYECLRAVNSFSGVREMILEFHHAHLLDIKSPDKYREITKLLEKHFINVYFRPVGTTKKAWCTLVYCRNY